MQVSTARSFRTCHLARPLNPVTFLPNSSVSSKDGAEGVKSASVLDEDGFARPESALLELDSSASEESASLELEVSGPPLLDSISNGSDSPESDSEALDSSGSVSDDSGSGSSGLTGPASDDAGSSAPAPDGSE
ncbi:MAG: hypothetical protein ACK55Z_20830, partial [bacterium]